MTQAEALLHAERFQALHGALPSRLDWRGANLEHFRTRDMTSYPSERQVQRLFGGWGNFLRALGETPPIAQDTARVAVGHVQNRLADVEVMPGASGTIDAFVGGLKAEIKGSSLQQDERFRTPRFRFRLHEREYSRLVDTLILVGIVGDEAVIEWQLDKVAMLAHADGVDTLSIPAKYPFNMQGYNLFFYERWKAPLRLHELIAKAGL